MFYNTEKLNRYPKIDSENSISSETRTHDSREARRVQLWHIPVRDHLYRDTLVILGDSLKDFYVVVRTFFLLLLNCSARVLLSKIYKPFSSLHPIIIKVRKLVPSYLKWTL